MGRPSGFGMKTSSSLEGGAGFGLVGSGIVGFADCFGAREVLSARVVIWCEKGRKEERVSHRRHVLDELRRIRLSGTDNLGCNIVVE